MPLIAAIASSTTRSLRMASELTVVTRLAASAAPSAVWRTATVNSSSAAEVSSRFAVWRTATVNSSSAAEVSSRFAACRSVRCESSLEALRISSFEPPISMLLEFTLAMAASRWVNASLKLSRSAA
ncbi:hypothetical protein D3C87_1583630 [compost metagenome]